MTVCAMLLTADRPEMTARAISSFLHQTYPGNQRYLYIFDTGEIPCVDVLPDCYPDFNIVYHRGRRGMRSETIGAMRNYALSWEPKTDIVSHFDSDDWSHPNRIAEQVALLQASGKECVGYRDMLFWRATGEVQFDERFGDQGFGNVTETADSIEIETGPLVDCGEAWIYSNPDPRYCLGTSLCYWRKTWERRPFPDLPKAKGGTGEDVEFLREVDSLGVSSIGYSPQPRMIASIHGGNSQYYGPDLLEASSSWKRVLEWDAECRRIMQC